MASVLSVSIPNPIRNLPAASTAVQNSRRQPPVTPAMVNLPIRQELALGMAA